MLLASVRYCLTCRNASCEEANRVKANVPDVDVANKPFQDSSEWGSAKSFVFLFSLSVFDNVSKCTSGIKVDTELAVSLSGLSHRD